VIGVLPLLIAGLIAVGLIVRQQAALPRTQLLGLWLYRAGLGLLVLGGVLVVLSQL